MTKPRQTSAYARTRNRVRDRLRTENNKAREEREKLARRALVQAATNRPTQKSRANQALLFNTAMLAHKVLGSFNVKTPIKVREGKPGEWPVPVKAITDFNTIDIEVDTSRVDIKDLDSIANFVYMVKGAVYHEGGHNMFTTSFRRLRVDASRGGLETEWNAVELEYGMGLMHRAWNILEDQRMECCVVAVSPVIAEYFTILVYECILQPDQIDRAFPYVTHRTYLDKEIRNAVRKAALETTNAPIVPDVERVVANYCRATDTRELITALLEFVPLMNMWGVLPPHSETQHNYGTVGKTPQPMPEGAMSQDEDETEQSDSGTASDNNEDNNEDKQTETQSDTSGTDAEEDKGEISDEGNDTQGDAGEGLAESEPERADVPTPPQQPDSIDSSAGRDRLTQKIRQDLERLKEKATTEAKNFAISIHEDLNSDLPRDTTSTPMSEDGIQQADAITNGIIQSLEHLIDQTSPSWRFQQEQGVLDPTSYVLRDPGETNYWSGIDGIGAQGYDLSVAVLLDTSYSMGGYEDDLSVAALAIRKACDHIDVPCTITTWNTEYAMVYKADVPAIPMCVQATGGTEPQPMLDMLDRFRYDKRRQLVLILTDGEWEGVQTLGPWSSPGRYIVLVGFRVGWNTEPFMNKNADAFFSTSKMEDLPKLFRNAIAGFLA